VSTPVDGELSAVVANPQNLPDETRLADLVYVLEVVADATGRVVAEHAIVRGSETVWRTQQAVPLDGQRFRAADEIATAAADAIAMQFPPFGRVRFANSGATQPYYVYINEEYLGASVDAVELPVGQYSVRIARRDDGFEHTVGRSSLSLTANDFVEVAFALRPTPPPVPGFLRLADPADRWRAMFDVRGAYIVPLGGFGEISPIFSTGAMASVIFADVPLRGFLLGLEAGQLDVIGEVNDATGDTSILVGFTPLMATLGVSVGPISGVDTVWRVSAGMALTQTNIGTTDTSGITSVIENAGYAPAIGGIAQFGFGLWRATRLSAHTGIFALIENNDVFTMIEIGIGLGGRF
jgi:hypothetical protein